MDFLLEPPAGVGPLRIGMPRHDADAALDSLRDPSAPSASDRPGQHVFRPSGLMVSVHSMQGVLQAVEFARPLDTTDRVLFHDLDVFALPAREVVAGIREHTRIEADPEEPAFIAPDLLLSFWRPFEADDDPDDEQGHYFARVLLARPGYYDTPAEAEERLRWNS
ncbi:hypothetical protein EDD98_5838 [Streptomyces sp. PanSC19]|uniref:hypothetical protein n=1 Tax=Streptomyces sp. PanSC19 TaxID=1520455 RepID=UPI000F472529|nr:hypothetical protein [Streptomyces sp. PanSC19]ROQ26219.1 hypothetical protein EDD98_5838 [Streptomyces sp. PanSC19]